MLRGRTRALLLFLVASTTVLFGAAVVTLVQVDRAQSASMERSRWSDSVSSQVFGFERQFVQFRGELAAALAGPDPVQLGPVRQRYEILVSRINLLDSSSSVEALRQREEHRAVMPMLARLVESGDRIMEMEPPPRPELDALLHMLDELLPAVQGHTHAATFMTSRLIEGQFLALHRQTTLIGTLSALQMLLMGVAIVAVWSRHRQNVLAAARQQRLTDELREAKLVAEAAARTKSQFLANMSHELRTPFQGVLGMLQILERTRLNAAQMDLVQTAQDSANHLLVLLNEILDVSAIEAGKIVLNRAPLDLHKLLRQEVDGLMRVQAESRGLDFALEAGPDLPQWLCGDATRLKQILFNLLHNAIKFTPRGRVTLQASSRAALDGRVELAFRITDTGIGMSEETVARLFRRFELGETTLSRRFGGTGLGLEISRNLARLMAGDISVTSEVGRGSEFLLRVVLEGAEPPVPEPACEPPRPAASLKILVADDHPVNRRYLQLVLDSLGHEVLLCEDGEQAIELVQTGRFDAVLMDVHMPVVDGLAATQRIRALGAHYRELPIVALTADAMAPSRERALDAGVTAFLAKPVQAEGLSAALASVTGGRQPAACGGPAAKPPAQSSRQAELMAASLPAEQFSELLRMFFEDDARSMADLRNALGRRDAGAILEAAHKCKGSARFLGLTATSAALDAVERWARSGAPTDHADFHAGALDAAIATERAACSRWLRAPAPDRQTALADLSPPPSFEHLEGRCECESLPLPSPVTS